MSGSQNTFANTIIPSILEPDGKLIPKSVFKTAYCHLHFFSTVGPRIKIPSFVCASWALIKLLLSVLTDVTGLWQYSDWQFHLEKRGNPAGREMLHWGLENGCRHGTGQLLTSGVQGHLYIPETLMWFCNTSIYQVLKFKLIIIKKTNKRHNWWFPNTIH
jgi:hypothetical protein